MAYKRRQSFNGERKIFYAGFCFANNLHSFDDFKKVNDTYGHDCGDEILKFVAGIVFGGVRKDDNVFRWGGEEILILLNTDEENAIAVAEKILAKLKILPYILQE